MPEKKQKRQSRAWRETAILELYLPKSRFDSSTILVDLYSCGCSKTAWLPNNVDPDEMPHGNRKHCFQ